MPNMAQRDTTWPVVTDQQGLTFQQAARELRAHLKRGQQSMATFIGITMAALRTYESGKVAAPDARAATAYLLAAEACGRPDLVGVFGSALHRALGLKSLAYWANEGISKTLFYGTVNHFEERMIKALLACLRAQGPFRQYRESVLQALAKPWLRVDQYPESLRFIEREELEDQLIAFEKAMKSQPPAEGDQA